MKSVLRNQKNRIYNFTMVLVSLIALGIMQSCSSEYEEILSNNAEILSNNFLNITDFEKAYANSLSSNNNKIKVIGFKTVYVSENEREEMRKFVAEYQGFVSGLNCLWIAEDYSSYRIYFALHTAIVEYDGKEYIADEKGLINAPVKDISHLNIVGRKKSEAVHGSHNNIILKDRILFRDKLTQGSEKEPMKGYTIKENSICVFDLGERRIQSHHDHHIRLKNGSENNGNGGNDGVSCYQNHGNKTCSDAFGIRMGRCQYISNVCMDYNGPGTDCVNSSKNFIGSDCFYAMASFHCWNEIM
jgi:hypothetical protein